LLGAYGYQGEFDPRLAEPDAIAYYDVLRRRVRRTIVMRGLSLIALLCIFWVLRHRLMQG